jgi:hypothetical protein
MHDARPTSMPSIRSLKVLGQLFFDGMPLIGTDVAISCEPHDYLPAHPSGRLTTRTTASPPSGATHALSLERPSSAAGPPR